MALPVMEFIRRFLQHVLPTGFMKVRHYGFMSPTSSVELDEIKALIELSYGFENEEAADGDYTCAVHGMSTLWGHAEIQVMDSADACASAGIGFCSGHRPIKYA